MLQGVALFLVVVGARFYLIHHDALSLPYWDQWDGEGAGVLKRWLDGHLDWRTLFAPHNEHRIFLTRVLGLALAALNHQWDNRLEAAVNALFCGLSAVLIAASFVHALGAAYGRRIRLAVTLYFVLPFGWENTLVGFQSQNYFLIFFSLAAVWGLGTNRHASVGWWFGLLASLLACLSMATGFLAAVVVVGMRVGCLLRERRRAGVNDLVTLLWCVALALAGWFTRAEIPAHAVLKAEDPARFVAAFGRVLAWPACWYPWLGLLPLVPLVLLAIAWARPDRSDRENPPGGELLLGAGGWAVLQCAALAYGRGGQNAWPASRYMDLLAVVPLVSFLAWQVLIARERRGAGRPGWLTAAAALWLLAFGAGLWTETAKDFTGWLPWYLQKWQRGEQNLRGYIATGDFDRFLAGKPPEALPHPDPHLLAALVDDPAFRAILPADIRPPLAWQPVTPGFVRDGFDPAVGGVPTGAECWGSFAGRGNADQGTFRATLRSPNALPYLRFSFAGFLGEPGLRFALGDPAGNALRPWQPARSPRARWHEDYLRKPGPEFSVVADDHSAAHWFAFSAPVEVGFWSYWAGFFLRRSEEIIAVGLLLWVGLALPGALSVARAVLRRRHAAAQPPPPDRTGARALHLLSVVIPARDEAGSIAETVTTLHAELARHALPHEIVVVDDGSRDDTWNILSALTLPLPELRPVKNTGPHGFGRAIIYGLDRMQGDAVVVMMADASDAPADVVKYWQALSAGYDCAFGSRFVPGSQVHGYPWFKLLINRLANLFIRGLFRVGLNDTTNAFKAYRREVIEGCRPLISTHFNLTVELPLKAVVRGFTWQVMPISWRNRKTGVAKFRLKEMGSRYLFICLYLWLEKHLSRGDYRHRL